MLEQYINPEYVSNLAISLHLTGDLYLLYGTWRATRDNTRFDGLVKDIMHSWFYRYLPFQVGAFSVYGVAIGLDKLLESL